MLCRSVYTHGFTAGEKAVENQDWATGPLGRGPLACFYQNQLRAAFHKYGPSCGTSQKIDFVYILIIGSP